MHLYTDNLDHLPDCGAPMAFDRGRVWIVLGSGIGAAAAYRSLMLDLAHEATRPLVATCNAGIHVEPAPTVYWLTDPVAADLYRDGAVTARDHAARVLTSIHTLKHAPWMARVATDLLMYDSQWHKSWIPGRLCNGRTSGGFLVQLAAMSGASTVHLVGMAGYRSAPGKLVRDYDDGRKGLAMHDRTMNYYGPLLQSVMDQTPAVRFVFHGQPNYPWRGGNVEIRQDAPAEQGAQQPCPR